MPPSTTKELRPDERRGPDPRRADDSRRRIAEVAERNIRFIRLWFTDVLGQLKSFSINSAELEDAFAGGNGFDGSSITGFNPIEESDMLAVPDPTTFTTLPWSPEEQPTGADVLRHPGPRRRALRGRPPLDPPPGHQRADDMGFDAFNVGPELEFFYFRDASRPTASPRCSTRAATST